MVKKRAHDHIADVYNSINAKYGRGTYWIVAGDPILTLNNKLKNLPEGLIIKIPAKVTL